LDFAAGGGHLLLCALGRPMLEASWAAAHSLRLLFAAADERLLLLEEAGQGAGQGQGQWQGPAVVAVAAVAAAGRGERLRRALLVARGLRRAGRLAAAEAECTELLANGVRAALALARELGARSNCTVVGARAEQQQPCGREGGRLSEQPGERPSGSGERLSLAALLAACRWLDAVRAAAAPVAVRAGGGPAHCAAGPRFSDELSRAALEACALPI
jgi:hypothetical protein